jgi:hypothetical protein
MNTMPSVSQNVRDALTAQVGNGIAVLRRGKGTTKGRTKSPHADLKSYAMTAFTFGMYSLGRQAPKMIYEL